MLKVFDCMTWCNEEVEIISYADNYFIFKMGILKLKIIKYFILYM